MPWTIRSRSVPPLALVCTRLVLKPGNGCSTQVLTQRQPEATALAASMRTKPNLPLMGELWNERSGIGNLNAAATFHIDAQVLPGVLRLFREHRAHMFGGSFGEADNWFSWRINFHQFQPSARWPKVNR